MTLAGGAVLPARLAAALAAAAEVTARTVESAGAALGPAGAVSTTVAAVATSRHRLGFVHGEVAAAVAVAVELADRALRAFGVAHFHEREPARLAGGPIANDVDGLHLTRALE